MLSRLLKALDDPRSARRLALWIIAISVLPRLINLGAPIWDAHSWNQCSAASVARNMWRSGFDWLHPQWDVLERHSALPNVEAEEAPVYHVLAAAGYALFGESLAWARIVTILLYLPGAWWLFSLSRRRLGGRAAIAGLLFYAFAPINVFFNRAIASDTGMVSFGIGAIYYFDRHAEDGGMGRLLASAVCLCLAGLFKPFGLLVTVPILAISLNKWGVRALIRPSLWLYAVIALLPPLAWVAYAMSIGSMGRAGGAGEGLFGNLRLWGSPALLISPRWWGIVQSWLFDRSLTPPASVLAGIGILSRPVRKGARVFLWWALGCLLYLLFVRSGNEEHVYYAMPWMPPLCALAGAGLAMLLDARPGEQDVPKVPIWRFVSAGLLLAAFFGWTIPYTYSFFRTDRSSVIAGQAARTMLPDRALILAWDPGTTRKNQIIYHADREGWYFGGDFTPERIEEHRLLGATAIVVCLSDEQLAREDRRKTYEYLQGNYELIWSDQGPFGKRGEPHTLAIFMMPKLEAAEVPVRRFARELTIDNLAGPWEEMLPNPGLGDPGEPLTDEELRFGLVRHVGRGRLIHFLESRESLLIRPGVEYSFPLTVPERARLSFSATAWPEVIDALGGPLLLKAEFVDQGGERLELGRITLKRRPLLEASWRLRESWQIAYKHIDFWSNAEADLWDLAGRQGRLVFTCEAAGRGRPADLEAVRKRSGIDVPLAVGLAEPIIWSVEQLPRPAQNLLVILIDGLRPDAMSCYGYPRKTTPNIDGLARRGVLFEGAFAASNYTRGSTSGLFIGIHPGLLGVPLGRWGLSPLEKFAYRRLAAAGLTERLRDAGYVTCQIGSNPFMQEPVPFGVDAGFETTYSFNLRAMDTEAITETARRFISDNRDRPFELYLHYNNGHSPYRPPRRFKGMFSERIDPEPRTWPSGYDEEIAYADSEIGELLGLIEDLGLSESTLVIVTSDHGRGWDAGHPRGHGKSLYNGEAHVPLIVAGPGVKQGLVYSHLVSHLDIAPTAAPRLGLPVDPGWPGKDLGPALEGDSSALHDRIWLESGTAIGFKTPLYTVISKIIPYGRAHSGPASDSGLFLEIYDNIDDPRQLHNLAAHDLGLSLLLGWELFSHKRELDDMRWEIAKQAADVDPRVVGGAGDRLFGENFDGTFKLMITPSAGRSPDSPTHVISGRVVCDPLSAGWIDMVFPASKDVSFEISEDRRAFLFEAELADEPASIAWRTFPEITPFSLELSVDGVPMNSDQLSLGPWGIPYADMPAHLGIPRDYWMLLSREGAAKVEDGDGPRALLWIVDRDPSTATGAMADEVKGALRQWGYVK